MSEYIIRNKNNQINTKASIHAFAMAVGRQIQEEKEIKKDPVIRKAIRKAGPNVSVGVLTHYVLREQYGIVSAVLYNRMYDRIQTHIRLNRK